MSLIGTAKTEALKVALDYSVRSKLPFASVRDVLLNEGRSMNGLKLVLISDTSNNVYGYGVAGRNDVTRPHPGFGDSEIYRSLRQYHKAEVAAYCFDEAGIRRVSEFLRKHIWTSTDFGQCYQASIKYACPYSGRVTAVPDYAGNLHMRSIFVERQGGDNLWVFGQRDPWAMGSIAGLIACCFGFRLVMVGHPRLRPFFTGMIGWTLVAVGLLSPLLAS
jgi:hypothetical protein